MTLIKDYAAGTDEGDLNDSSLPLTSEMLKSLCFNCDNRKHCTWKDDRKRYCQHFE